MTKRTRRILSGAPAAIVVALASCMIVPEVLAFPYHRTIGDTEIYAEAPLPSTMPQVLARSDRLLRASAIYGPGYARRIFLTGGGWRWHLLSVQSSGAFGLTRPLSGAMIVNRSDPARDLVFNGAAVAGKRSLSGVIAHERTPGLIRARFGITADAMYPAWLREGYCDVVAGGGSLSDTDARMLKAQHQSIPALAYYDGRKRVEAMLRTNGGSVDALFSGAG